MAANSASIIRPISVSKQDYDTLMGRIMDAEVAAIELERRQKQLDELDLE